MISTNLVLTSDIFIYVYILCLTGKMYKLGQRYFRNLVAKYLQKCLKFRILIGASKTLLIIDSIVVLIYTYMSTIFIPELSLGNITQPKVSKNKVKKANVLIIL